MLIAWTIELVGLGLNVINNKQQWNEEKLKKRSRFFIDRQIFLVEDGQNSFGWKRKDRRVSTSYLVYLPGTLNSVKCRINSLVSFFAFLVKKNPTAVDRHLLMEKSSASCTIQSSARHLHRFIFWRENAKRKERETPWVAQNHCRLYKPTTFHSSSTQCSNLSGEISVLAHPQPGQLSFSSRKNSFRGVVMISKSKRFHPESLLATDWK